MTCHSSNCFSIVWGRRNAPLVTFPSSCYVTPGKAWQEPMEKDKSLSVIYAIHMKMNWQPSKPSFFFFRLRRVTRTFHVLAVHNYDKEVYKKKCAARAKSFFFLPIRFIVLLFFFFLPFSLPCRYLEFLFV